MELGWIIGDDEYSPELFLAGDRKVRGIEEFTEEEMFVEHSVNNPRRLFISWVPLQHGWNELIEPTGLGVAVRRFVHSIDPGVKVTWGIIEK